MLELRLVAVGESGDAPHGWLQCPCVRGRRSTRGFACECDCHGVGGMATGSRPPREANIIRLTRKLGA